MPCGVEFKERGTVHDATASHLRSKPRRSVRWLVSKRRTSFHCRQHLRSSPYIWFLHLAVLSGSPPSTTRTLSGFTRRSWRASWTSLVMWIVKRRTSLSGYSPSTVPAAWVRQRFIVLQKLQYAHICTVKAPRVVVQPCTPCFVLAYR